MKRVIVHWVEMRTLEVPDECPTDNVDEFEKWIYNNGLGIHSNPYEKSGFAIKLDTRNLEIVDVSYDKAQDKKEA